MIATQAMLMSRKPKNLVLDVHNSILPLHLDCEENRLSFGSFENLENRWFKKLEMLDES